MRKMGHVKNTSHAVLGNGDDRTLWEDIVSHIPDEVLLKKDVRILNIACGHAEETKAIIRRMLVLGRTKEEIRNAIVLNDKYSCFTNPWYHQGFEVVTGDFLEWETDMKFDVVIGNPPYQQSNAKHIKLWFKFLERSLEILREKNSVLVFVTPDVWINEYNEVAKKTRKLLSDSVSLVYVNVDVNKYFTIGESVCVFLVENNKQVPNKVIIGQESGPVEVIFNGGPILLDSNAKMKDSIFRKLVENEYPKTVLTRVDANGLYVKGNEWNTIPTKTCNTKVYFSHNEIIWSSLDFTAHQKYKLIFNNSGYYFKPGNKKYIFKEKLGVAGNNAHQLILSSKKEVDNAYRVYTSKLYRFFVDTFKSGGFNSTIIRKLPMIDFTRTWTDEELYKHFRLTKEEIAYIEETVK